MDRDKRWGRIEKSYQAIFSDSILEPKVSDYVKESYKKDISDEFITPVSVNSYEYKEGDSFLFFNFRADRMREIISSIYFEDFKKNNILTMTKYSEDFDINVLFSKTEIKNFLGKVISDHNLTQFRIAETEKYPHVTYFLNGGEEAKMKGEDRSMIQSPTDVKTYDQKPEMSAYKVKETILAALKSKKYDFLVMNFANPDMVGHSGKLDAAIKAVETIDECLGEILEVLKSLEGQAIVIADHGNVEMMIKEDGSPHTTHTTFPVPIILFPSKDYTIKDGKLADIAPSILKLMGLTVPNEMTGENIIIETSS
ncbi:UNVERIFIED_CONTAM: hypothetical protein GTU68_028118 [Idotea baltica]|nr:hypothetical protein [Idotea baltica]